MDRFLLHESCVVARLRRALFVCFAIWLRHRRLYVAALIFALELGACKAGPTQQNGNGGRCLTTAECSAGQVCFLGVCQQPVDQNGGDPSSGGGDVFTGDAFTGDAFMGDVGVGDSMIGGDSKPPCVCSGLQSCNAAMTGCDEPGICLVDTDCLMSTRWCVKGGCTAVAPDCRSNDECAPGVCFLNTSECVPEICTTTPECPQGLFCDAGSCVDCMLDSDCGAGNQICTFGFCSENDIAGCTVDLDCLGLRECDIAGNFCVSADCGPTSVYYDAYEPNDMLAGATTTTKLQIGTGNYDITLCDMDVDWFRLQTVGSGDGFVIRATFDPTLGQAGLEVHDEDGNWMRGADDLGGVLMLGVPHAPVARPYLAVRHVFGTVIPVNFAVEVIHGGFCLPDAWETNDDSASAQSVGTDPVQAARPVSLCRFDQDWFTVDIRAGSTFLLSVETTDGPAVAVEVYQDSLDNRVSKDTRPTVATKEFASQPSSDATYYVWLYPLDDTRDSLAVVIFSTQ